MKLKNEIARRVHPRLRMIYNGDGVVNGRRAERSGVVCTTSKHSAKDDGRRELPDWKRPAEGVRVSTFVEMAGESELGAIDGAKVEQRGRLAAVEIPLNKLHELADLQEVSYVSSGELLETPNPKSERVVSKAPDKRQVAGAMGKRGRVLIGIIDVGGFDFAHPDFLDRGKTRFEYIWDQGLEEERAEEKGEERTVPFGYEFTKEQLDDAIEAVPKYGLPATELLRQSLQIPGSHATHVASIAGGNLGSCSTALLAGVSIAIPEQEADRRRSFYDSAQLAHAVDYLFALPSRPDFRRRHGLRDGERLPVVINISLGTNGHAHDGSSPISRWIDAALDEPGRCVVVATGNAGQEAPRVEGDLGFLSGRIHSSGRVDASGLEADLEWEVLGDGSEDMSENEMEIWYEPHDRFEVLVKPPSSDEWIGPVEPGKYIQNLLLDSGTLVSVYSERYHPANGANRISVFLSPRLREPLAGVEAGQWLVRLRGTDIRDGTYHAWIERDDARPARGGRGWAFPSVFSEKSNTDNTSVNSLACGHRVLAVANYERAEESIHMSSSQGPTRDGRTKPEVAAPGTSIVAANGFGRPERPWMAKTGTSMASPYVAGVVACMLAREPQLTAAQIIGMVRRTAQPLPGANYRWQDAAGFGRIRPEECLAEVGSAFLEVDLEEENALKLKPKNSKKRR